MKTIHPLELEAKIEANEPVEIVDLRPRGQFEKRHVPGAHSILKPSRIRASCRCPSRST